MFDTPHLVKAVRNMLLKYDFVLDDEIISWKYIKQFYERDKKFSIRAAPKLTDSHIFPTIFQKMKVKLATQVFSATVAASLNVYIRLGALPQEAAPTSQFIDKIDKLFDLMNSSKVINGKKFNLAFKGLEHQLNLLNDSLRLFKQLKVRQKWY